MFAAVAALPSAAYAGFSCPPISGSFETCDMGSSMPIYDQTNPNFATVNVPDDIYCSEMSPTVGTAGHLCTNAFGYSCSSGDSCTPLYFLNNYNYGYNTWLPKGAFNGDPEYQWSMTQNKWVVGTASGSAQTEFCGGVAGMMVFMAAYNNKSSSTTVRPASWTAQYVMPNPFTGAVGNYNPDEDKHLPSTLLDATAKAGAASSVRACHLNALGNPVGCMDRNALMRVMNYNILRSVDPTNVEGSNDGQNIGILVDDFLPAASYWTSKSVSFAAFRSLIRTGSPAFMRHTKYYASVDAVICPTSLAGKSCYNITATKTVPGSDPPDTTSQGHYEALRGYTKDASGYTFTFNNPNYGHVDVIHGDGTSTGLSEVSVGTYVNCGGNVYKRLVGGGDLPDGQTQAVIWPVSGDGASRLCDMDEGESTHLVTSYYAYYIE